MRRRVASLKRGRRGSDANSERLASDATTTAAAHEYNGLDVHFASPGVLHATSDLAIRYIGPRR